MVNRTRYTYIIMWIILMLCYGSALVPYWDNPQIHYLGNTGIGGRIHSFLAEPFNSILEHKTYNGMNVRNMAFEHVKDMLYPNIPLRICDVCCGTGISTRAGHDVFPESHIIGIDTSLEMLDMCDNSVIYKNENAEDFSYQEKFDVISVMFALHEIPRSARIEIIDNIKCNLKIGGICIILDISPEYIVTPMMRGGEPYVDEYVNNIRDDLCEFNEETIVDGHLSRWILENNS